MLGPAAALCAGFAAGRRPTRRPADTVGPRELQDFSLSGTVTRPAEQPAEQPPAAPGVAARERCGASTRHGARARAEARRRAPRRRSHVCLLRAAPATAQARIGVRTPTPLPAAPLPPVLSKTPVAAKRRARGRPPRARLRPSQLPIWPWILAALVLAAGAAFLFLRNRSQRLAFAGGPRAGPLHSARTGARAAAAPGACACARDAAPSLRPSPRDRIDQPAPVDRNRPQARCAASSPTTMSRSSSSSTCSTRAMPPRATSCRRGRDQRGSLAGAGPRGFLSRGRRAPASASTRSSRSSA